MADQSLSILLADDDLADRELIRYELEQTDLHFSLSEAENLTTLLDGDSLEHYDCAFVDYDMPEKNGLECISSLKEAAPYMGIIMITGQGNEAIAAEAFKRGASDYIAKRYITASSIKRIISTAVQQANLQKKIDEQREDLQDFSRVLVHDIRSPLLQIDTLCDRIIKDVQTGKIDKIETYCKLLKESARHSVSLIDTLNEYNQVVGTELNVEEMSMSDTIKDLEKVLESTITEKNATITCGDLPTITANPPLIKQLLQNLIGNGIKYCETDKPHVHISCSKDDKYWIFEVKDNGIGIPEMFYKKVFEAFSRLHTSSQYAGTGLGLATCKKIVSRHNGNIWCSSQPGNGTSFYFTIPR